ncbi:flagellar hook-basal body complex protein FliE [Chitinimonas lacunae]|uniref:Flagellar hook-basal body complex protein FliE n=1 Tax=Chitinimonas lacunae TaxID=1963018 RepID=A0ABV8MY26_9NEIS
MSIEAIAAIAPIQPIEAVAGLSGASAAAAAPAAGFADWFSQQISQTNGQLVEADRGLQKMAVGEPVNLHQVMIDLEEAKMSMQLLLQVRNRLLDAYQDVMRMQM